MNKRNHILSRPGDIATCDRDCFYLLELAGDYRWQIHHIGSASDFFAATRARTSLDDTSNRYKGIGDRNQEINNCLHFLEYEKLITVSFAKNGSPSPTPRIKLNSRNQVASDVIAPTIQYYSQTKALSNKSLWASLGVVILLILSLIFSNRLLPSIAFCLVGICMLANAWHLRKNAHRVVHQCLVMLHEIIVNRVPVRIMNTKLHSSDRSTASRSVRHPQKPEHGGHLTRQEQMRFHRQYLVRKQREQAGRPTLDGKLNKIKQLNY